MYIVPADALDGTLPDAQHTHAYAVPAVSECVCS